MPVQWGRVFKCGAGHPISEDRHPWHLHLLSSIWWNCHYLFLPARSVTTGSRTPISFTWGERFTKWATRKEYIVLSGIFECKKMFSFTVFYMYMYVTHVNIAADWYTPVWCKQFLKETRDFFKRNFVLLLSWFKTLRTSIQMAMYTIYYLEHV